MSLPPATPFRIDVDPEQLSWVNNRVRDARIAPGKKLPPGQEWSWGISRPELVKLHQYWVNEYDWRLVEKRINDELPMYTMPLKHGGEDLQLHFVHQRSTAENAIPLLFIHGWPGNFLEVRDVIESLATPSNRSLQQYHVVAPSLPGFGFSSYPSKPCSPMDMAALLNQLMVNLGYSKYMAQGGDWGSMIGRLIAIKFPNFCVALHLNMVIATPPSPLWHPLSVAKLAFAWLSGGRNLTAFENRMLKRMQWWLKDESGYQAIQSTKPHTISFALADSPVGMLGWIRDKLEALKDKDFEWDLETVITWSMIYIINGSPGHAEIYRWSAGEIVKELEAALFDQVISKEVAVGASIFPNDVTFAPRWWAECKVARNIVFWKEHEKGGHFASVEVPDEFTNDIRAFTSEIRPDVLRQMQMQTSQT